MNERKMTRSARLARLLATGAVIACAIILAGLTWRFYVTVPWTRDGQVRVQVAAVGPQISGQITELHVVDNQHVSKGDLLYVIDPFDFKIAVALAEAEVENRAADLQVKRVQSARRDALTALSTSTEEKQQYASSAKMAEAAFATAQSQLAQARMNLERTQVRAPVNGYVNNLLLRVGDYASPGNTKVSLVDSDSFWIDGYFEETKMARIRVGERAQARLMGYAQPIEGHVESITRGIATANASPSTQGLPNVDPVYTWVRLAQRVPVRVRIDHVPDAIPLIAGMTATVVVRDNEAAWGKSRLASTVSNLLTFMRASPERPGEDVSTSVDRAKTVSSIPVPDPADQFPAKTVPSLPMNPDTTDGGPPPPNAAATVQQPGPSTGN